MANQTDFTRRIAGILDTGRCPDCGDQFPANPSAASARSHARVCYGRTAEQAADLAASLKACTGAVSVTVTDGPIKVTT